MTRLVTRLVTVAALATALASGTAAHAQTSGADGGDPAVTEPGGTMGRDGAANIREGVRSGEAVGVPPDAALGGERLESRRPPERPTERR